MTTVGSSYFGKISSRFYPNIAEGIPTLDFMLSRRKLFKQFFSLSFTIPLTFFSLHSRSMHYVSPICSVRMFLIFNGIFLAESGEINDEIVFLVLFCKAHM